MVASTKQRSYYETLNAAVEDLAKNGYDSAARVKFWSDELRKSAERLMGSEAERERAMREALEAMFRRMVSKGQISKYHLGSAFNIEKVRPQLRAELDRRILASASLIRLNRKAAIEKTLQRFEGWSTSIPVGGSADPKKGKAKVDIKKSMRSLPFVERRVLIDQGHKLVGSINEILATDNDAIAGIWKSKWRQAGYDYREDHKERDGQVYLMRDSWAVKEGLVKPGKAGYYDDVTAVGEEIFCRCHMLWVYNLSDLPREMLTKKGIAKLEEVRGQMKGFKFS